MSRFELGLYVLGKHAIPEAAVLPGTEQDGFVTSGLTGLSAWTFDKKTPHKSCVVFFLTERMTG